MGYVRNKYWVEHNNIVITIGGTDRKPLKAEMAKGREGREFVDTIKRQLLNNSIDFQYAGKRK